MNGGGLKWFNVEWHITGIGALLVKYLTVLHVVLTD